jgi:hypothetical protein
MKLYQTVTKLLTDQKKTITFYRNQEVPKMKACQLDKKPITYNLKPLALCSERRRFLRMEMLFPILLLVAFCLTSWSYSQVPQTINYQQAVTDAAGNPLNGSYNITFSLYAVSTGGTALWTQTQNAVPVTNGVFNVLLPIPYDKFDGYIRYLGIAIAPDPEMTPRREIVSVPYAYTDGDWDIVNNVLFTHDSWGIAGHYNTLYGNMRSTHVNFGSSCTTGTDGQDYGYCTVGGGRVNAADGEGATVGGGEFNTAIGLNATIGGGANNTASAWLATVGGGFHNIASGAVATIGGGAGNVASGVCATVPGGELDTVAGDHSFAFGELVRIREAADRTFAFGCNFETSTPNAVIFHNSVNPIKVGIGTTAPTERLDVVGTAKMTGFNMPTGATAGYVLTSDVNGVGTWQAAPGGGAGGWTDDGTVVRLTTSTDKVGIGTTNPTGPLEVEKSTAGANAVVAYFSNPSDVANTEVSIDLGIGTSTPTEWRVKGATNNLQISNTAMGTPGLVLNSGHNVGIGLAAPLDPLDVNGDIRVRGADVRDANGVSRVTLTAGGDLDLSHNAGGSAVKILGAVGDVGIGIAPQDKLDVNGDVRIRGADIKDAGGVVRVTLPNGGALDLNTIAGNMALRVAAGGNVGIWQAAPADPLDVNGDVRVRGGDINDAGGFTRISLPAGGNLDLKDPAGNMALTVTPAGNVGIGVAAPDQKLDVDGTVEMTGFKMAVGQGAGKVLTSDALGLGTWRAPAGGGWSDDGAVVRLTTITDNVGIGTAAPSQKLHVEGTVQMTGFKMTPGASDKYVLTSDANGVGTWQVAAGDSHWIFRITDTADTTLTSRGRWGLARFGNELFGNGDSTHVNFGVGCTTGTNGLNQKYCSVGGGLGNSAGRAYSTVAGGGYNKAKQEGATVGGGEYNITWEQYATVGGGYFNSAIGQWTTVAGGTYNSANGVKSSVGGGAYNVADGQTATIGGGNLNSAVQAYTTVGGGYFDSASGQWATVAGGTHNAASGMNSSVGGGAYNSARGDSATVGGGARNIARGNSPTIGGGAHNQTDSLCTTVSGGCSNTANAEGATVPGGCQNTATGIYSLAAGKVVTNDGNYTLAFGRGFATGKNDAVIFYHEPGNLHQTKVGIGVTDPQQSLDVNGTARLRALAGIGLTAVWVDGNGDLQRATSSKRYKTNIRELETAPEAVLKLKPVRFEWISTGEEDIGLIAEDVEQAIPDLVIYDKDGRPDAVKYDRVSIYLLELVRAQQEEIKTLKAKVEQLEAKR